MTTNKPQLDLPEIPSLPPIEIPDRTLLDPSDYTNHHEPFSPMNPSSVSLVSQESFTTADSSLSEQSTAPMSDSSDVRSPSLFAPPPALPRKSLSEETSIYDKQSCGGARSSRGSTFSHTARTVPDNSFYSGHAAASPSPTTGPSSSRPVSSWKEADSHATPRRAGPSRSRGTSISNSTTEDDSSLPEDSDWDREDIISMARKTKGSRKIPRPEELPLPSRLQTVSSSPTMGKPPPPIVPERNSSLHNKLTKQRSLISVNTHLPPSPHQPSDITLAVVGASGSGKSTVIRKGLKSYGLSDSNGSITPPGGEGGDFRYVYRVGRIGLNQAADRILRVIEVDIPSRDLSSEGYNGIFPEVAPPIDGLVLCYDASDDTSYVHVEAILRSVSHKKLPTIAFACKSDLQRKVDPKRASAMLDSYDVGLIEASTESTSGKEKMRIGFEFLFKAIFSQKANITNHEGYRNPASPAVLTSTAPWDISRASSATPTASSTITTHSPLLPPPRIRSPRSPSALDDPLRTPRTPLSPTRTRSMSDLLADRDNDWDASRSAGGAIKSSKSRDFSQAPPNASMDGDATHETSQAVPRQPRLPSWMSLDELLDKLLFVAVSDDDPTFISHFLLTYRRFTFPRTVLLAMQKRVRALDQPSGDPMFACFAQMRICWLLDHWIRTYPHDFAVAGTAGALSALIKSIVGKTYLLHYGSEFIPFMESLPTLKDKDYMWAIKSEELKDDSDGKSSVGPVPSSSSRNSKASSVASHPHPPTDGTPPPPPATKTVARERKHSLPLAAKVYIMEQSAGHGSATDSIEHSPKTKLKILVNICNQFLQTDPSTLAQEITRVQYGFFMMIEPRHWLQHVITQGPKDPETDMIAQYNHISNHLAEWVVSLILCQDKMKTRSRVIAALVELAGRLRNMNNYSALRAIVAGINSATFESDESMRLFRRKEPQLFKRYQSFDHLLQAARAHGKYRMALKNSKGACIPALEIHLSDLIRAHEANKDFHGGDNSQIHWAKFNMMGRFIDVISQAQQTCRETGTFAHIQEDLKVHELLILQKETLLMDSDLQKERILLDRDESTRDLEALMMDDPTHANPPPRESPHTREGIKKILFW